MCVNESLPLWRDGQRLSPVFIKTPASNSASNLRTTLTPSSILPGSYLNRGAGRRDRPMADSDCLSHSAKLLICLVLFPDSSMFIPRSLSRPTDTDIGTHQYYDKGEPGK